MQGEWSCYRGGYFNGENDHVTEVDSVMEGEWLCYRRMVLTEVVTNGGRKVMLQRWPV